MTTSLSHYLLEKRAKVLDDIESISGEVYARAVDKFENEVSRELFLKMSKRRRKD